jgi:DNA segregation ATPase FtsK/SpoIIIE-like protein
MTAERAAVYADAGSAAAGPAVNNRQPLRSRVINLRRSLPISSRAAASTSPAARARNSRLPAGASACAPAAGEPDSPAADAQWRQSTAAKPTTPLPSLDLLTPPPSEVEPVDTFALEQMARLVEARLADFRIKADVVNYSPGPVITRFELNLAPGVKAARISNLSRDLARSLSTARCAWWK